MGYYLCPDKSCWKKRNKNISDVLFKTFLNSYFSKSSGATF
jgi:hypothetical protein